jgi:adenylosuccinate synthase
MTEESQLPSEFMEYVKFLEDELKTPISVISVGPDRKQTINR